MTISNELMRAILAMDVYNRGYNQGVNVDGLTVGDAVLRQDALPAGFEAASFFAQAYTLADGSKVISYRGTDQLTSILPWTEFGSDIWNGYGLHTGSPEALQANLTPSRPDRQQRHKPCVIMLRGSR